MHVELGWSLQGRWMLQCGWAGCGPRGGLLGPLADGWDLSVPALMKMPKRHNFLCFFLRFRDGLWEENFLCGVSTAWLQLLLRAAQLIPDGWVLGSGVPAPLAFLGSRLRVGVRWGPGLLPEGWKTLGMVPVLVACCLTWSTALRISPTLCYTAL